MPMQTAPAGMTALSPSANVSVDSGQTVSIDIPRDGSGKLQFSSGSTATINPDGTFTFNPAGPTNPGWEVYVPVDLVYFRKKPSDPSFREIGRIRAPGALLPLPTFVDTRNLAEGSSHATEGWLATPFWSQTPTPAPSLTASAATPTGTLYDRVYAITHVSTGGVEGARSGDSPMVQAYDGYTPVNLSLPAAPAGVAKTRIYRRNAVLVGGVDTGTADDFYLVTEIPAAQRTYEDVVPDASLGAQMPLASRTVVIIPDTFTASAEAPPNIIPESRSYVYTYVTAYGEEGPPSPPSTLVDVDPEATVTVTGMLGNPDPGQRNITKKRIYRTSTGTNLTTYQFVAEVDIGDTSYADAVEAGDLGEVIPSIGWVPPPEDGHSLTLMANGIALIASGKTIRPSVAFQPHAYPEDYSLTTEHHIVGMGAFGQNAAILTTSYPYIVSGVDPAALTLEKLHLPQACASRRSIVETGDGVIYASPDGLIQISVGGARNLTEGLLNRDQWQAYNPETMHCNVYNGKVYVFHDTGCLIFDFGGTSATFVTAEITPDCSYYDPISDALFLGYDVVASPAAPAYIKKWDVGSPMTYVWRSRINQLPKPTNFAWAQVEADAYPVTMRVFNGNDTDPLYTLAVTGREPFRLPSGSVHRDWWVELEGTSAVYQVALAERITELQQV